MINKLARLALNSSAGESVAAPEQALVPLDPFDRDDQRRVWDMALDSYLAATRPL